MWWTTGFLNVGPSVQKIPKCISHLWRSKYNVSASHYDNTSSSFIGNWQLSKYWDPNITRTFHLKNTNSALFIFCCLPSPTVKVVVFVAFSWKSLQICLFFFLASFCLPHFSQRVGDNKSFWFDFLIYFLPFLAEPWDSILILSCQSNSLILLFQFWIRNEFYRSTSFNLPGSLKAEMLSLTLERKSFTLLWKNLVFEAMFLYFPTLLHHIIEIKTPLCACKCSNTNYKEIHLTCTLYQLQRF